MRGYKDNDWPSQQAMERYFADAYKFIANKYGAENIISAFAHFDEATPHLHINFVPITSDGRLSAKDLFSRKTGELRKLQDEFYDQVGAKQYLERGKKGSKTKHRSDAEYKLDRIYEQINYAEGHLDRLNVEKHRLQGELSAVDDEIADKLMLIERYDQVLHDSLAVEQEELNDFHKSKQEIIRQQSLEVHSPPPYHTKQAPQPQRQVPSPTKKKYQPSR